MAESSESKIIEGNLVVKGNLNVEQQVQTKNFKVLDETTLQTILSTGGDTISFRKACDFHKPVQFNNGQTLIGIDTTYNSAYVGSPTIQAGERLVVGDSLFKITTDERKIIADTFNMTLREMDVNFLNAKKETADLIEAKDIKVSNDLIGKTIYADAIKSNKLFFDKILTNDLRAATSVTTKDLIVGNVKVENGMTIMGKQTNGSALTVNDGAIIANQGIISHTRNNRFQTLQIMGSGTKHDVCFMIDKYVDSLIQGDVTIQDSKLILDNSTLATDNILVASLENVGLGEPTNAVQLTTSTNWDEYKSQMIVEMDTDCTCPCGEYDPVNEVENAVRRNEQNQVKAKKPIVTSYITPINYMMEKDNPNVPSRFSIKNGTYRIDSNGNHLLKNIIAQDARFNKIEAYQFNANRFNVDKIVTTSVAANVVDTDNLLRSRGLAEFDGSVSSSADIFLENGSSVNVDEGSTVTFQDKSSLVLRPGAKFEMSPESSMKMSGPVEINLDNAIFISNGIKYKLSFRNPTPCEGDGVVLEYTKVEDEVSYPGQVLQNATEDAEELTKKLNSLGL